MINTIKINELEETNTISNDDYLIVETQDGTKKSKVSLLNNNTKIDNLSNDIVTTNTQVNTLTANIIDLTNNVTTLEEDLNTNVSELTEKINSLSSDQIKTLTVSDGVLQLTKDKYQTADIPAETSIKLPINLEEDKIININLLINAKEDKNFLFEDIKWKERPDIKNGYDYIISFIYVDNVWYGKIIEYKKIEKTYLYKNGDECIDLTGGYNHVLAKGSNLTINSEDKEGYGWAKQDEYIEYEGCQYAPNTYYKQYFETANDIDFSNYAKMYIEYSIEEPTNVNARTHSVKIEVGNATVLYTSQLTSKTIIEYDIRWMNDSQKIRFGYISAAESSTITNKLKIYKIWLVGNDARTTKEIINDLSSDITTIETNVDTLTTNVRHLTPIVASLESEIDDINEVLNKNKDTIDLTSDDVNIFWTEV